MRLLAFTRRGYDLARTLGEKLGGKADRCGSGCSLEGWTAEGFLAGEELIFVGAVGIAVRAVAPFVKSKTADPAVVVVDEGGSYAIPILSGHLGGANDLARRIARVCGAQAVITTATDVRGCFPVDQWAGRQGLKVENPKAIKLVSARALEGEHVRIKSDFPISGTPPQGVELVENGPWDVWVTLRGGACPGLKLVPPALALGVGCRRGTRAGTLERAFEQLLEGEKLSPLGVKKVCSIHLKREEPGLLAFCQAHGLNLETFSPEALAAVPGDFPASDFVRQVTGVDNVCQRSAALGSGGELLGKKYQGEGVTMALALGPFPLDWRIYEADLCGGPGAGG